jgi:hypothetical protein
MSDKSRARAVQRVSGWSYQKCLTWVRASKSVILKWSMQLGVSNSEAAARLWKETEGGKATKPVLN